MQFAPEGAQEIDLPSKEGRSYSGHDETRRTVSHSAPSGEDSPHKAVTDLQRRVLEAVAKARGDFEKLGATPRELSPEEAQKEGLEPGDWLAVDALGHLSVVPALAPEGHR